MIKSRITRRAWSLILVLSLALQPSVWSLPGEGGIHVQERDETLPFLRIEIPVELASVEGMKAAPAGKDSRILLHIENLHGHPEAQMKIQKLLHYLHDHYGFQLIFVEGASEKLNRDYLKLFEKKEQNQEAGKYLVEKGRLTGVESFLLDEPKGVEVVGIEHPKLYREEDEAYRRVRESQKGMEPFLEKCERELEKLSAKIFSSEARRMALERRKFHKNPRAYLASARYLVRDAKKYLGTDLESLFAQIEWPQMTRFLVIQNMEKDLDSKTAERERAILLEFLKQGRASPALLESITRLGNQEVSSTRLSAVKDDPQDQPRTLLERLVEEAGPKGFRFQDYPAFSLYAGYWILKSELRNEALFREMDLLFEKILNELAVTEMEKNLSELFRDEELLDYLLRLRLSRQEWNQTIYRKQWIRPDVLIGRLLRIQEQIGEPAGSRSKAALDYSPRENPVTLEAVQEIFETAFAFYEGACRREVYFARSILKEMESRKTEKAVLVTGGFHAQGISELLKGEMDYALLLPKLVEASDLDPNAAVRYGELLTLFDAATFEAVSLMQSSKAQRAMGEDLIAKLKVVLEAYIKIGRFKNLEDAVAHFNFLNRSLFAEDNHVRLVISPENSSAVWIQIGDTYLSQGVKDTAYIVEIPTQFYTDDETGERRLRLADHIQRGPKLKDYVKKIPRIRKTELKNLKDGKQAAGGRASEEFSEEPLPEDIFSRAAAGVREPLPENKIQLPPGAESSSLKLKAPNFEALAGKKDVALSLKVAVETLGSLVTQSGSVEENLKKVETLRTLLEDKADLSPKTSDGSEKSS